MTAVVTLVCASVFINTWWMPKGSIAAQAATEQRPQQPSGAHKKKGKGAKKKQRGRATAAVKMTTNLDVLSEEELEMVKVQSSDVEAPSAPSPKGSKEMQADS